MTNQWMHNTLIIELWKAYSDMLIRAVKFTHRNPNAASEDYNAESLGYKFMGGLINDKQTVERMISLMNKYGVDLPKVAKRVAGEWDATEVLRWSNNVDAQRTRQLWNPEELRLIASMVMSEIILDTNISNRPPGMFSNPILRFGSMLWTWTIGKTNQLYKAFNDPKTGAYTKQSMWHGVRAMMMGIFPVSIAYAFAADWYDEETLGKKANREKIRRDDLLSDPGTFMKAYVENIGQLGSLGLYGELGYGAVHYAREGDVRGLSVDGRVVAMRAAIQGMNAIATLIRQRSATYETVYRPMAYAAGGGGYLQYAQIINNNITPDAVAPALAAAGTLVGSALGVPGRVAGGAIGYLAGRGLGQAEHRVTNRINAENWIRSTGRALNMDVRIGRGMTVIATPMRPKIGLMVTSALDNDSQAFDIAHREAIALAYQMEGQDDPEGYIRRAYMARHPLIRVFQTRPSDTEVSMLFNRMPQRASSDVLTAVTLFNRYAERIGSSPFTGKKRTIRKSSVPSIFRWQNAPSWDNMLSGTF